MSNLNTNMLLWVLRAKRLRTLL